MTITVVKFVLLALFVGMVGSRGTDFSYCTRYRDNQALARLSKHYCVGLNEVFRFLHNLLLRELTGSCTIHMIGVLAHLYPNGTSTHTHCRCHGINTLKEYPTASDVGASDNRRFCLDHYPAYKDLYARFFETDHSKSNAMACRTHQSIWSTLRRIDAKPHDGANTCLKDIIYHIRYAFVHNPDNCTCGARNAATQVKTSVALPSITFLPSTLPSSTKTLPSTTTTQRTIPTLKHACNKLAVVEDLAKFQRATHPDSSACNPNAGGSDDAYVLSTCNMTSPVSWTKGANVLADCQSSTRLIPTYTPISTFIGDNYVPLGAQSGIFLGCYNTGIKMAIQKCNGFPEVVRLENGDSVNNPKSYYVIV